jgi:hypothetical protein
VPVFEQFAILSQLAILQSQVMGNLQVTSLAADTVNVCFVMSMQDSIASCMMFNALDQVLYPRGISSSSTWEM